MSLFTTMLESSCIGQRPTIGRDAASGTTQDHFLTILGSTQPGGNVQGVPCSVQEASARVQDLFAQRNAFVDTEVFFASDPDVEPNDLLQITDRTGNTSNYLVMGESQAVGRGRLYKVACTRVRSTA